MTGLLLMELFSSFQMGEKKKFNQKLMDQIKVFGRVKPKQKTQIITILQEAGYCIAMVGDGANDCGALKQADIGLALSEAEASVTSPFTSKDLRIGSLLDLLKDARAGLVTSFQCFKYMAFYSLTQYITIILLYYKFTTLSDSQFLYIDLLIVCPLFITMSMTGPCKNLSTNRPRDSLFSIGTIFSVFGLLIIQFIGQFSILFMINYELDKNDEENINYFKKYNNLKLNTYESDSLFIFSNFLYIGGMLAFSMGRPFRKPFYSNWVFTINIIIITTYNILIIFVKKSRFYELEINQEIKNNWGWCIVGLGFIWMIIMILFEQIICEKLLRRFEKDNFLK